MLLTYARSRKPWGKITCRMPRRSAIGTLSDPAEIMKLNLNLNPIGSPT